MKHGIALFFLAVAFIFPSSLNASPDQCPLDSTLPAYECLRESLRKGDDQEWHHKALELWIRDPQILQKAKMAPTQLQTAQEENFLGKMLSYFGLQAKNRSRAKSKYYYLVRHGNISDIFRAVVLRDLERIPNAARQKLARRGNYLAWHWAYAAEAAQKAFARTGDERFAKALLTSFREVLALRDNELGRYDTFHRRVMNSWGSGIVKGIDWVAHVTLAGRIVRPVTALLVMLNSDPNYKKKYQYEIETLTNAIKDILLEFDRDYKPIPGAGLSYYWRPSVNEAHLEPLNHAHEPALSFLNLYRITNEEFFLQRAEEVASVFFETVKKKNNGSLCWPYFPKWYYGEKGSKHMEYIWKGAITIPFVIEVVRESPKWSVGDIDGLKETLRSEILTRDHEFHERVCGQDKLAVTPTHRFSNRAKGIVGWMEVEAVEPRAIGWLADLVAFRPDLFPGGWLETPGVYSAYTYIMD